MDAMSTSRLKEQLDINQKDLSSIKLSLGKFYNYLLCNFIEYCLKSKLFINSCTIFIFKISLDPIFKNSNLQFIKVYNCQ